MPDRVKQSIFDMLGVYYDTPGGLPPLNVADLFAGSGSMGLEALSRGARKCWFFERDRAALSALRENIAALEAGQSAVVLPVDAWRPSPPNADGQGFDLMFLDPPYRDVENVGPDGLLRSFLRTIAPASAAGTLIVFHHPATVTLTLSSEDQWTVEDRRILGTNGVTLLLR